MRLKGDWVDHIAHATKLSFRVKIQKEGYVFGMKRFSIQHPATRMHHAEVLFLDEMRRWDILAPRYFLVDVRINDYRIGIMAMEEHFSKELLESQQRREGPVIVVDEDLWWRQKDLNARYGSTVPDDQAPPLSISPVAFRDLPIKQFRPPPYLPGTTATNNSVRAMSLYRDYMDGALPPESVFDIAQVARWWVLVNVWNGCHGVQAPNRRFYFNPTTNLLEPIAFDNSPRPDKRSERRTNCGPLVATYLLGNVEFQHYVREFSDTLLASYQDPQWQDQFRQSQKGQIALLELDGLAGPTLHVKDLQDNLTKFIDSLQPITHERIVNDRIKAFSRRFPNAPIYSHVRAFLFPSENGMELELKNLTSDPLNNIQITMNESAEDQLLQGEPWTLPYFQPATPDAGQHIATINIDQSLTENTSVTVNYQFRGQPYSESAIVQFRNHNTGFEQGFLAVLSNRPGINIDPATRTISFGKGQHLIDSSLEIGKGWSVSMVAGAQLKLSKGATLKINGPLFVMGSAEDPVLVEISPAPDYRGVGAWGGILVSQSKERSRVEHAILRGAKNQSLVNRQDYYGITGCLSFYESDVDITASEFSQLHCEDALNIVRSDFTIRDTVFRGARADSFDSDFSHGNMVDSHFESTGNDAVDVSGTELTLENVHFSGIGDKAVSVGEESLLQAKLLNINGASTGIASKDLSIAHVSDSSFNNISGSGLITYVKKSEYGSASIECVRCTFNTTQFIATNQNNSTILIDDIAQPVTNFNQVQLEEAGFVAER